MNKIKYGLKNVHYAMLTEIDGDIQYGVPVPIHGAVNLSMSPSGDTTSFYADDLEYFTAIANNGYDGNLEIAVIPDSFYEDALGETADDSGVYVETAEAQSKPFALLFEFSGDEKATRHVMYNCKSTRPNVNGSTKTKAVEPKPDALTLTARPLANGIVKARTSTATPDDVYDQWYKSVFGQN